MLLCVVDLRSGRLYFRTKHVDMNCREDDWGILAVNINHV